MITKLVPSSIKEELKLVVQQLIVNELQETKQELQETKQELQETKQELQETNTLLNQYISILTQEHNVVSPPPKKLQQRVVGDYSPRFISSGLGVYADFNTALRSVGKHLSDFHTVLDFGCGCGRILRTFKNLHPEANFFGTDIDPEAIEWLKINYSSLGNFLVAPHSPPLGFEDECFEFIYGISVFTHLPEDIQFLWLKDLHRVSKKNSYLILTTHGTSHAQRLAENKLKEFSENGFYFDHINYGKTIGLPDFYQNTYHSHDYIRNQWGKFFKVLDIIPLGVSSHQDLVLLQKM